MTRRERRNGRAHGAPRVKGWLRAAKRVRGSPAPLAGSAFVGHASSPRPPSRRIARPSIAISPSRRMRDNSRLSALRSQPR